MTTAELSQRTKAYLPPDSVVEPKDLQQHVLGTYFDLRTGIWVLGFALPLFLWLVGKAVHIPLQPSISDYYFAAASAPGCPAPPPVGTLRNEFVGTLVAV